MAHNEEWNNMLPTPTATDISHSKRVKELKKVGAISMMSRANGALRPNGLMDYLQFNEMLITPSASDGMRSQMTMESLKKHNKPNADKSNLAEQIAHKVGGGKSQLNPMFVAEMMGFNPMWTILPMMGGGKKERTDKPNSNANAEELLQDSVTNPCSLGFGECQYGQAKRQGQKLADEGCDWPNFWERFPTQSPICRGDDGFPFGVDDMSISIPQWRKESIKAYGNAWVPQVAYEIFKAISLVEENKPYKKIKEL